MICVEFAGWVARFMKRINFSLRRQPTRTAEGLQTDFLSMIQSLNSNSLRKTL